MAQARVQSREIYIDGAPAFHEKRIPGFYRAIYVTEDWIARETRVCGATYPIRHELRIMGFRWNHKDKCWVIEDYVSDEVGELLKTYGCILAGASTGWGMDLGGEAVEKYLCPWRR